MVAGAYAIGRESYALAENFTQLAENVTNATVNEQNVTLFQKGHFFEYGSASMLVLSNRKKP